MSGKEGVLARVHRAGSEIVFAACDKSLLGKRLVFGKTGADFRVSGEFYGKGTGEEDGEFLDKAILEATSINLLGEEAIRLFGKFGEDSAILLDFPEEGKKVPHLASVIIRENGSGGEEG